MKRIAPVFLMVLTSLAAQAQQDTLYLDAQANVVRKSKATSCMLLDESKKDRPTARFYTLTGALLRTSEYKRFSPKVKKRILHGVTRYKFAGSTQDSLKVFYTDNQRNGGATFYYPNGNIMAQGIYKNGMLNGLLRQFYENGRPKRTEIYKEDVSQGGVYLSPDSTVLEFIPFFQKATYTAGKEELEKIVARNIVLDRNLLRYMVDKGHTYLTADIGLLINKEGKAVKLSVLRSDAPDFHESSFKRVLPALKDEVFIPATLDGCPCSSMLRINGIACSIR